MRFIHSYGGQHNNVLEFESSMFFNFGYQETAAMSTMHAGEH